ncbi:MAG: DJ-1/PfpI family protein [Xanthomonadales bacterium]|nr:DJ-1/PfpI family protein [Xanthomonadales bacterium]
MKKIGILIFDDVEVLDFCGPFEVFSSVRLDNDRHRESSSPYAVLLVAESEAPIVTRGGMEVRPQVTLASCPSLDLLVVPGGWGVREQLENAATIEWIRQRAKQVSRLTSVCTGSMLLGEAGLLDGRRATTHWRSLDWMRESFPAVRVVADEHVVEDGDTVTSAGISAGIDMALRMVARDFGDAVARETAAHMEYPYPTDNRRRVAMD